MSSLEVGRGERGEREREREIGQEETHSKEVNVGIEIDILAR